MRTALTIRLLGDRLELEHDVHLIVSNQGLGSFPTPCTGLLYFLFICEKLPIDVDDPAKLQWHHVEIHHFKQSDNLVPSCYGLRQHWSIITHQIVVCESCRTRSLSNLSQPRAYFPYTCLFLTQSGTQCQSEGLSCHQCIFQAHSYLHPCNFSCFSLSLSLSLSLWWTNPDISSVVLHHVGRCSTLVVVFFTIIWLAYIIKINLRPYYKLKFNTNDSCQHAKQKHQRNQDGKRILLFVHTAFPYQLCFTIALSGQHSSSWNTATPPHPIPIQSC